MPECGSQVWLCDLPVRFDTYKGCSHGCRYCFAQRKADITKISRGEGVEALKNFCEGNRNAVTSWCDWKIPLHWGGMSDPFQPCEAKYRNTYECLKYLAKSQYPFIVSTKGRLVAADEYLDLLARCNCVVQVSAVCSAYDKLERGCPSYEERVKIINKVSKRVKRTIVRIQPYMHEVYEQVFHNMERLAEAGAYGVIVEGMKFASKKKGLVKVAGDFCYPYEVIKDDFVRLKEEAHRVGLKCYAGENRIRELGDSLTCCGVDGLDGFKPNHFNMNHLMRGEKVEPTIQQAAEGTGTCFKAVNQKAGTNKKTTGQSFARNMLEYGKLSRQTIEEAFGMGANRK